MKTLDQLMQDCLDHGIVDVYEDFPFVDPVNCCVIEQPAALRNWCIDALATG